MLPLSRARQTKEVPWLGGWSAWRRTVTCKERAVFGSGGITLGLRAEGDEESAVRTWGHKLGGDAGVSCLLSASAVYAGVHGDEAAQIGLLSLLKRGRAMPVTNSIVRPAVTTPGPRPYAHDPY